MNNKIFVFDKVGGKIREIIVGEKIGGIVAGRDKNVITIMFTYFFIDFTHMLYRFDLIFFLVFGKMSTRFSAGRGTGSNPRAGIVVIGSRLAFRGAPPRP